MTDKYTGIIYNFGRDTYGNTIAHWMLMKNEKKILENGQRRKQTGYDNHRGADLLHAAWEKLGLNMEVENYVDNGKVINLNLRLA
jgi:hypothetical protein